MIIVELLLICTEFVCQDEGTGVETINNGDVEVFLLEETYYLFFLQELVTLIRQVPHEA